MPTTAWPALGTTIAWSTNGTTYTGLGQVTSIGHAGGGEVGKRDTSNLGSTAKTYAPTIPDNGEVTFDLNWDPSDTGHQQLRTWKDAPPGTMPFWKVTFPTTAANTALFNGFVSNLDGPNAGGTEDNLTMSVTVQVSGSTTYT